ncbi:MAG TPA: cupredoxin family copper-binding protein [Chthoniobacterales bacterium]|nr:cupredoxin family copper-binding protein [Chthoniobacterales bacterium]
MKHMIAFIRQNKKAVLLAILIVLNFCLAARGDEAASIAVGGDKRNTIEIRDFMFNPPTLTVKAGDKITWINRDDEPHTVVSVGKKFQKSSALDTDQEFTITAGPAGTYEYFCSVHPKMTGTIVVEK